MIDDAGRYKVYDTPESSSKRSRSSTDSYEQHLTPIEEGT